MTLRLFTTTGDTRPRFQGIAIPNDGLPVFLSQQKYIGVLLPVTNLARHCDAPASSMCHTIMHYGIYYIGRKRRSYIVK